MPHKLTFDQYQDIILAGQLGTDPRYLADSYDIELITVINIVLYDTLNWERLERQGNVHQ